MISFKCIISFSFWSIIAFKCVIPSSFGSLLHVNLKFLVVVHPLQWIFLFCVPMAFFLHCLAEQEIVINAKVWQTTEQYLSTIARFDHSQTFFYEHICSRFIKSIQASSEWCITSLTFYLHTNADRTCMQQICAFQVLHQNWNALAYTATTSVSAVQNKLPELDRFVQIDSISICSPAYWFAQHQTWEVDRIEAHQVASFF